MPALRLAPSLVISPMACSVSWWSCGGRLSANDLLDDFQQLGRIEGLDQPAGGARAAACLLHLVARLGREDEDRRRLELRVVAQLLREADAIHARHVLVGEHEVEVTA